MGPVGMYTSSVVYPILQNGDMILVQVAGEMRNWNIIPTVQKMQWLQAAY